MSARTPTEAIEAIVREEWGRTPAALAKSCGDLERAEDCLQEAVIVAMQRWPEDSLPDRPAAWLLTTARRRAIDLGRRDKNFASKSAEVARMIELDASEDSESIGEEIPDRRLELIFFSCHPSIEQKSQIALALRVLGGLSTEEIAASFLDKPETMGQRLSRAKKKISAARIPFELPTEDEMPKRLSAVLRVIYLIFNAGWSARGGQELTRVDLSGEAIRLGRILYGLLPEPEVAGLLALMLLHDSRRFARTGKHGEFIPLKLQNRARWDKGLIGEGLKLLQETLPRASVGPYQLQATISAFHVQASCWGETEWTEISALYGLLRQIEPSPVVEVNRAVALSYAQSVEAGLDLLNKVGGEGELDDYQPYFAAKADLLSRIGERRDAQIAFERAISLTTNEREADFLRAQLAEIYVGQKKSPAEAGLMNSSENSD